MPTFALTHCRADFSSIIPPRFKKDRDSFQPDTLRAINETKDLGVYFSRKYPYYCCYYYYTLARLFFSPTISRDPYTFHSLSVNRRCTWETWVGSYICIYIHIFSRIGVRAGTMSAIDLYHWWNHWLYLFIIVYSSRWELRSRRNAQEGGEGGRKEEGKRRKIGMVIYDKRNGVIMVAEWK